MLVGSDVEDAEDVEDYLDYEDDEHVENNVSDVVDVVDVVDVRDVTQTIGGLCEVLKSKANDPSMKSHIEDFQLKITWLLEMLEAQRPQHPMPLRLRWLTEIEPCTHMA